MIGIFSFQIHNIFWETHTDVFADSMSQNQGALDLLQGKVQGGVGGEGGEGRGQEGQVGVVVVVVVVAVHRVLQQPPHRQLVRH